MPAFRDISVKYKITAISLLTSYVVLVLASVVFVGVEWMGDRRAIGQELETIADIIGNNSTAAIVFDDRDGAEEILAALRAKPNIEWAYLYRADGTVLAKYVADAPKGRPSASEYDEERIDAHPALLESDGTRANNLVFSYRSIDLYRPIHLDGKAIGAIFIRSDLEQVYASIATYIRIAALVILLSCVLAFLLISQLHKVVTQPILHLLDTIRVVSANQDFSVRAKKHGADELGVLIDGFNMMLARTQTHDQSLRVAHDRAEAANRAKSEFLANMSHELRTPLNAILGFSEIIKDDMCGAAGAVKYRDYASNIHESGRHLLDLINDILDLSKVESGGGELQEEVVEIHEFVRSIAALVTGRAEEGGVEVALDVPDEISAVRADRRKLKQILVNLLSNAIKFTPTGGKVTLRIWSNAESGYVFRIIDTGIGMALKDIPKALTPFQQIDGALERKYEGTGLGLPLAKALVEMHGGSLDLQSAVGVGTTVTVRFPAERIVASLDNADSLDVEHRAAS